MLLRFQNNFLDYVLEQGVARELQSQIDSKDISAKARLEIYKNNIFQNLTNALKIAYPKFIVLVGEEFFEFLAYEFIKNNLPSSGMLLEYGANLSEFIEDFEPLKNYSYAADFASFEWLSHQAHHAMEERPIALKEIAKAVELDESYIPSMRSCVHVFYSKHPILSLYEMCEKNTQAELPNKESYILINKNEQVVEYSELSSLEYNFLKDFPNVEGVSAEEASLMIQKFCKLKVFKF